jgi:hypothetical protein
MGCSSFRGSPTTTTAAKPFSRAQREFADLVDSRPGIVLSSIDPVYLNALLPHQLIAAPLDGDHNYRFSKIWHYDRPEALALVERSLRHALPIYALFVSNEEMTTHESRLPTPPGYQWTVLKNSPAQAAILQLVSVVSEKRSSL